MRKHCVNSMEVDSIHSELDYLDSNSSSDSYIWTLGRLLKRSVPQFPHM